MKPNIKSTLTQSKQKKRVVITLLFYFYNTPRHKVAELQGIEVLNINQLATSLKPAILPGEQMNIKILKEGKEYGQGIGYLDDGTMVVVDEARKLLGRQIDVVVTSVLQTTAGRMIFSELKGIVPEKKVVGLAS